VKKIYKPFRSFPGGKPDFTGIQELQNLWWTSSERLILGPEEKKKNRGSPRFYALFSSYPYFDV
jgi:hypothetical protein